MFSSRVWKCMCIQFHPFSVHCAEPSIKHNLLFIQVGKLPALGNAIFLNQRQTMALSHDIVNSFLVQIKWKIIVNWRLPGSSLYTKKNRGKEGDRACSPKTYAYFSLSLDTIVQTGPVTQHHQNWYGIFCFQLFYFKHLYTGLTL